MYCANTSLYGVHKLMVLHCFFSFVGSIANYQEWKRLLPLFFARIFGWYGEYEWSDRSHKLVPSC